MTSLAASLFGDITAEVDVPKQQPVYVPPPDEMADKLMEHGFVPNRFILDLNGSLTIPPGLELPYPWNLPSRLFHFPIEVGRLAQDGTRQLGLMHPLLADHPYVKQVESVLGIIIDPGGAKNEYGYTNTRSGTWWHAVDLVSKGKWESLLDTARFTTSDDIAGAVCYGLHYSPYDRKNQRGHISTAAAREIMAALDCVEPADRAAIVEQHFMRPAPATNEKGTVSWPINTNAGEQFEKAWGHILGIESGWFAHDRAGFLGWTEAGRKRFPPIVREPVARPPAALSQDPEIEESDELAVTIADEIAPRPDSKLKTQLDLFSP